MTCARLVVAALFAGCLAGAATLAAEDPSSGGEPSRGNEPLAVGSEGVPVPKKIKDFKPKYPPEAVAQGIRGIVILELVIDATGQVESVSLVRSVPGLDNAALAAAHQWRYEPVKVAGRPVRVRMTVPITFSLALPRLIRDPGVPELRQGVMPVFPQGAQGGGKAAVAVMLNSDGRIAVRGAMEGSTEPWTGALLSALDTWRFSPVPDDSIVSFRIEAEFVAGSGARPNAVSLKATGLKIADASLAQAPAAPASATPAAAPVAAPPPAPETPRPPAPSAESPAVRPSAASPTTAPAATAAPSVPAAPVPAAPVPAAGTPAASAAPALEVVSAPLPALPPESGISMVRDILLEAGVPELARGRRPVPPPVARMAGETGTVEVTFSVSAAGTTTVRNVTGPELLKKAAEQAVASWVFRRTRADRAYLIAVFKYGEDKATASVRPQPAASVSAAAPEPKPAAPPAAGSAPGAAAPGTMSLPDAPASTSKPAASPAP